MTLLLLKVTVLFAAALAVVPLMKKAAAAQRYLVFAATVAAAALLPLTLLEPASGPVIQLRVRAASALVRTGSNVSPAISNWLLLAWLAGAAALLARVVFGYIQVRQVIRRGALQRDGIYVAEVSVPIACGLLRPVILLPEASQSWPAERIDSAIRHEQAHIHRGDLWMNLFTELVCAAWWFHPLVWLIARRLKEEQEIACDDLVISAGIEPATYAEALLAAAQHSTSTNLLTGCPMLTTATLKSRIARVLDTTMPRATSPAALFRTGLVCAVLMSATGLLSPVRAQDDGVYRVGGDVTAPSVLQKVEPQYTSAAHEANYEGAVLLGVVIGPDGLAHDVRVVKSLGMGLDEKAVDAVLQWRFKPGEKAGVPVSVRAQIEIKFRLD